MSGGGNLHFTREVLIASNRHQRPGRVHLDPKLGPSIRTELTAYFDENPTRGMRGLTGAKRDEYIGHVERQLRVNFLATLDPHYARALTHARSERNTNRLGAAILASSQDRRELDPAQLERTPPGASAALVRAHQKDAARTELVLQYLADHNGNAERLELLVETTPDWLTGCAPEIWTAIGSHAAEHGRDEIARSAYRKARQEGADTDGHRLLVLEALTWHPHATSEGLKVLEQASGDPDQLVEAARHFLGGDADQLVAVWNDSFTSLDPVTRHLASSLKCAGYINSSLHPEAVILLEAMLDSLGRRPWTLFHLARTRAVIGDAEPFGSHEQQEQHSAALAAASESVLSIQQWAGPTLEQTQLALRLALSTRQPNRVIELGSSPPLGTADPDVSGDPEVSLNVATAHLQLGQIDQAVQLGQQSTDPYLVEVVAAARHFDDAPELSADHFNQALAHATSTEQRVGALAGLASLGQELTGLSQLDEDADRYTALLQADRLIALGDYSDAIGLLDTAADGIARRHRIARCHMLLDNPIAAADLLLETGVEFRHARSTIDGADVLLDHGHLEAAETALRGAIVVIPTSERDGYQIRARLMQICIDQQNWRELEYVARAALDANPHRPEAQWAIIEAHVRNGRLQRAHEQLRRRPDLDAFDEFTAVRKIGLIDRFESGNSTAVEIISLADRFEKSERVRAAALAATRSFRNVEELSDEIAERARDQWESFFADFPDSDYFSTIKVNDGEGLEAIVAAFRPILEPRARMLDDLASQCRDGTLPIGMFSYAARVPYAAVCLNGGPHGITVSVAGNQWITQREIEHAKEHLDKDLVFDTMALATAVRTNNTWMLQRGAKNLIAESTGIDIRSNDAYTDDTSDATIGWDLTTDTPLPARTEPTQLAAQRDRAQALTQLADTLTEHRLTKGQAPPSLPDELVDEPWIAGIALAHEHNSALVSDDYSIRSLARHLGITTFGSYAVLLAQHEQDSTTELQLTSEQDALVRIGLVDLPDSAARMVRITDADHVKPYTGAMLLARAATWRDDPGLVLEFRHTVHTYLAENDRTDEIPPWAASTALGYALCLEPQHRLQGIADQFTSSIMATMGSSASVAHMLAAVRSTLRPAGLDPTHEDPLPLAVQRLRDFIVDSTDVDPQLAAPIVVRIFEGLEEADRSTVLTALIST